jgi:hypothetical protein
MFKSKLRQATLIMLSMVYSAAADGPTKSHPGNWSRQRAQRPEEQVVRSKTDRAAQSKTFEPDPDMPGFTLPDPLLTADGLRIDTAEEWMTRRRSEVMELFRKNVYGRVPETSYTKSFKVIHQNPQAMGGAATLKQVQVTLSRGQASLTISVALFIRLLSSGTRAGGRLPYRVDTGSGRKGEMLDSPQARPTPSA